MRQIATLPADRAELFADYLLTLNIETQLERLAQEVVLWVRDEDKVPQARTELEAFLSDPGGTRYAEARGQASALREQLEELENEEDDEDEDDEDEDEEAPARSGPNPFSPLTLTVALACVLVFFEASAGNMQSSGYEPGPTYDALAINSSATAEDGFLVDVRRGEVWRLFTPALLHFGAMHLAINVFALIYLGSIVEQQRGALRTLLLMLLLAGISNLAQYAVFADPRFGGASGVLFGLIGYLWIKGARQPELGMSVPPAVMVCALIWLVCGWLVALAPKEMQEKLGAVGNLANMAHTAGLLAGMALALLPSQPLEREPAPVPKDEAP